ncbi:MAG: TIGR02996 domain-containing protein [Rhizobium sp.]|nr:MAG: TIGR02996 domain-containing protein [Rhizobium sp.]
MTATTSDGAALLAAILADPADDTARLVYADWLQEHGEPCPHCGGGRAGTWHYALNADGRCGTCDGSRRVSGAQRAAFIRASIAEEKLTHTHAAGSGGCRRCKLARVVCRYIERNKLALFQPFPITGPVWYGGRSLVCDAWEVTFSRGFISEVTCTAADWLKYGEAVLREHPIAKVQLPEHRIEIVPPGPDRGWQLRYYRNHVKSYYLGYTFKWSHTRADMVELLMRDVRARKEFRDRD